MWGSHICTCSRVCGSRPVTTSEAAGGRIGCGVWELVIASVRSWDKYCTLSWGPAWWRVLVWTLECYPREHSVMGCRAAACKLGIPMFVGDLPQGAAMIRLDSIALTCEVDHCCRLTVDLFAEPRCRCWQLLS